VAISPPQAE